MSQYFPDLIKRHNEQLAWKRSVDGVKYEKGPEPEFVALWDRELEHFRMMKCFLPTYAHLARVMGPDYTLHAFPLADNIAARLPGQPGYNGWKGNSFDWEGYMNNHDLPNSVGKVTIQVYPRSIGYDLSIPDLTERRMGTTQMG